MRTKRIAAFMLAGLAATSVYPCTLAVISGKATRDGRALMWKNRDTDKVDNKTLYLTGPKYAFIALVDAGDAKGEEAWGGLNSEGFAVMYSQTDDQGAPGRTGRQRTVHEAGPRGMRERSRI